MTATKVRHRRCSSSPVGRYNVQSYNPKTKNKHYDIVIADDNKNTCTCVAFAMKRNKLGGNSAIGTPACTCKHIQAMLGTKPGCGWTSVNGETPQFETVCPRCYSDTVIYDIPRDIEDVDLDELMADFLALQKRLRK